MLRNITNTRKLIFFDLTFLCEVLRSITDTRRKLMAYLVSSTTPICPLCDQPARRRSGLITLRADGKRECVYRLCCSIDHEDQCYHLLEQSNQCFVCQQSLKKTETVIPHFCGRQECKEYLMDKIQHNSVFKSFFYDLMTR